MAGPRGAYGFPLDANTGIAAVDLRASRDKMPATHRSGSVKQDGAYRKTEGKVVWVMITQ
jgi:hypothetical protein